jgi:hypothetical protein
VNQRASQSYVKALKSIFQRQVEQMPSNLSRHSKDICGLPAHTELRHNPHSLPPEDHLRYYIHGMAAVASLSP